MRKDNFAIMLTDTHLDKNNLLEVRDIFSQCFEHCLLLGLSYVFHLGDIFTSRTGQSLEVMTAFLEILEEAKENGITLWCISGNHDKTDQESKASYLDMFKYHPAMNLFDDPETHKFDGLNVHFLPYFPEDGTYYDKLALLSGNVLKHPNSVDILLTHVAVDSVKNNDGSLVQNGLTADLFDGFDNTFIGHYHDRQSIGDKVHYIGSARQNNFGENDSKGFVILKTDGSFEYIQSKFKGFFKIDVNLDEIFKEAELIEYLKEKQEDNFVRVVFSGSEEQLASLNEQPFKQQGIDVKKKRKNIEKAKEAAKVGEVVTFDKNLIKKSFIEFCKLEKFTSEEKKLGIVYLKNL